MSNTKLVDLLQSGSLCGQIKQGLSYELGYRGDNPVITYNDDYGNWTAKFSSGQVCDYDVCDEDYVRNQITDDISFLISENPENWLDIDLLFDDADYFLGEDYYDDEFEEYLKQTAEIAWNNLSKEEIKQQPGFNGNMKSYHDIWVERTMDRVRENWDGSTYWAKMYIPYNVKDDLLDLDTDILIDFWLQDHNIMDYTDSFDYYYFLTYDGVDWYYHEL